MYHVIAAAPASPYGYLYVPPRRFAREMAGLRAAGYCAITLDTAAAIWSGQQAPPAHCLPLVLRFDDGYQSAYSAAFPVLRQMGWPANLCQQVQRVDLPGGLTAAEIRNLLANGWDLADHGYRQPEESLFGASPTELRLQVAISRQELAARFDTPVSFYCWPLGYYDAHAIAAVRQAGFTGALGITEGDAAPGDQSWWALDAIPAWGGFSSRRLVADVQLWQRRAPGVPPSAYGPPSAPPHPRTTRRA